MNKVDFIKITAADGITDTDVLVKNAKNETHPFLYPSCEMNKGAYIIVDYGKFCYLGLRHSLCHGWSSGFIDFFYSCILGVTSIENAYKTIKIEPHLCGLTYAEGKIPTKYGIIAIKHTVKDGKIETEKDIPCGITLI